MKIESLLILVAGALLWFGSSTFRDLGLGWWLLILDVVPAAIMVFWTSERHKILLFGVPAAILVIHTVINVFTWIANGFILQPLTTLAWLAVLGMFAYLCFRKEGAAA
jgi:hypothetical protein